MRSTSSPSPFRLQLPLSGLASILAVAGILLSVVVAVVVYHQSVRGEEEAANAEASVFADSLAQRTRIAQAYLRAVAARVRGESLRLSEFEDFVGSLGPEPALESVVWLPRVRGPDRGVFEASARRQGSVGFEIRDRTPDGELIPAAAREEYFPVRYVAGTEAAREQIGLDLAAEESHRRIIAHALERGRTAATRPGRLESGDPGFLLVEPVMVGANGTTPRTLSGLVAGMFRLDLLVAAAAPAQLIARDVVIVDLENSDSTPVTIRGAPSDPSVFSAWPFKDISIGGRSWRVFLEPVDGRALEEAIFVLLIGLMLTGLTVVLADRGQQRLIAQDLRREVARQTAALQRSTAEFRALFEEGGAGKCELVPETQHFRRVNLRLCEMLGRDQDELVRLSLHDVLHPDDRIVEEPAYRALLDGNSDTYFAEKRFVCPGDELLWCEISATVLRDDSGRPVWTVAVIQDITNRKQAEETRRLLVRELAHRVKNTLQVARSLADQTGRYVSDLDSFLALYQGRLRALAMAHDQLFKTDWSGAQLDDVITGTLNAFGPEFAERVELDVPDMLLPSSETQTLALILNELATNAAKYGALSDDKGRVAIVSRVETGEKQAGAPDKWLCLEWTEEGGPEVTKPERPGFGMTFLTRAIQHQHGGSTGLEWLESGIRYTMRLPLHIDRNEGGGAET
jgi:PAS domain S-box-containing protein